MHVINQSWSWLVKEVVVQLMFNVYMFAANTASSVDSGLCWSGQSSPLDRHIALYLAAL